MDDETMGFEPELAEVYATAEWAEEWLESHGIITEVSGFSGRAHDYHATGRIRRVSRVRTVRDGKGGRVPLDVGDRVCFWTKSRRLHAVVCNVSQEFAVLEIDPEAPTGSPEAQLIDYISKNKITHSALADLLGVSRDTLRGWLYHGNISNRHLKAVRRVCGDWQSSPRIRKKINLDRIVMEGKGVNGRRYAADY